MKKMIARPALVASLAFAAVSLTACGDSNDCANAASSDTTVTATTAMFPAKGGGGGHSGGGHTSSHSSSEGGHSTTSEGGHSTSNSGGSSWFAMPHWFGGSHAECKSNPAPSSKS